MPELLEGLEQLAEVEQLEEPGHRVRWGLLLPVDTALLEKVPAVAAESDYLAELSAATSASDTEEAAVWP